MKCNTYAWTSVVWFPCHQCVQVVVQLYVPSSTEMSPSVNSNRFTVWNRFWVTNKHVHKIYKMIIAQFYIKFLVHLVKLKVNWLNMTYLFVITWLNKFIIKLYLNCILQKVCHCIIHGITRTLDSNLFQAGYFLFTDLVNRTTKFMPLGI